MYACGPTVYNPPHIGNARAAVVYDLLYRVLMRHYPNVIYARNITDVDDKINAQALEENVPINVSTDRYTAVYHRDMEALGVLPPVIEPRATDHIAQIIDTTESLRIFQTQANLGKRHVGSLSSSYPFSVTKWWSTYTNAGLNWNNNIADFGDGKTIDASQVNFNVYHQSTFKVSKPLSFQVSGFYRSASLWGANFIIHSVMSI